MADDDPLDALARRLAGHPIPRRTAIKLAGAAVVGVTVAAPLRPRLALAQVQQCTPATESCRAIECPTGTLCCYGPPDPATVSRCPTNPHCCDPCDPNASRCLGDGSCGPGPVAASCGCGASGIKCAEGEYCDQQRGICCPPDPRDECRSPEPTCRDRVNDDVKDYQREVCLGKSDPSTVGSKWTESTFDALGAQGDGEKAAATLGCMTFSEAVLRRSRLDECRQVADDSRCGGSGCDGATGLCRRGKCSDQRSAPVARAAAASGVQSGEPFASATTAAGTPELRRAVDRGLRRMRAHARAAGDLFALEAAGYRRPDLADALRAMRADVLATRRSVARLRVRGSRARRGRREVLTMLREGAGALELAAQASLAADPAGATALGMRSRAAFKRAGRASRRASKLIR